MYLPYDPEIPLLSIHTKEIETFVHKKKSGIQMFIATLFKPPKIGNNSNIFQGWINKHIMV